MLFSRKTQTTCSFQTGTKNPTKKKFIVEPSFFTSWTIANEKCTRAHVQENKSTYLSIDLSIWKPFWKRVYIYIYIYTYLLYRHKCFTGKYTTRKIHKNYIRDTSGWFSIISHDDDVDDVISVISLCIVLSMSLCLYNKKNITRWLEDLNFIFSWQKQYFTHTLRSFVKYCFVTRK